MKIFSELIKKIKKGLVKYFGKKQKEIVITKVETQPQTDESKGGFPKFRRKNNRKATKGRRIQSILLPNGKYRFIMHNPY